mmetsp:Transcript_64518/g.145503  ORF Transcript_64518/g.145503 Transcript_64518/m.145503 type:complete len:137 (+) Transcript_64518:140-550(+)|eukprot:CAMPEP_0172584204 /NCGR_PEP_ID=MMETSP1068-20121228/3785_1 /TAXON_ID=35684 /ORGANISM="Pseudopedinella elastica, Strain CCMP716" /LENGTH=136 /DNA_ID=CAMNT_0013378297 /DNA_START=258 /DNA_END=668 /DNA_ORIENTATION=+
MTAVSLENLTVLMTPEDLAAAVDMSDSVLVVIDVHKKWCGPCDAMFPTFTEMWKVFPECDRRMSLYSAEIEILGEDVQNLLPEEMKTNITGRGCAPMFLVLRNKVVKAKVEGCNSPVLSIELRKYMGPRPEAVEEF